MELKEFAEYLVKSIAKEPDMVSVQEFGGEEDSVILEIIVHESDMGAVIGRNGKMASATATITIRLLISFKINFVDLFIESSLFMCL